MTAQTSDPNALAAIESMTQDFPVTKFGNVRATTADDEWVTTTRSATKVVTTALVVFAIVAALGGLLAIGQAIARQVAQSSAAVPILNAVGLTRTERSPRHRRAFDGGRRGGSDGRSDRRGGGIPAVPAGHLPSCRAPSRSRRRCDGARRRHPGPSPGPRGVDLLGRSPVGGHRGPSWLVADRPASRVPLGRGLAARSGSGWRSTRGNRVRAVPGRYRSRRSGGWRRSAWWPWRSSWSASTTRFTSPRTGGGPGAPCRTPRPPVDPHGNSRPRWWMIRTCPPSASSTACR